MPTADVLTGVQTGIDIVNQVINAGLAITELGVLIYLVFGGGWLDMIRLISYWLDSALVKLIDVFYSYFEKLLNGQIFAPNVVDEVMNRVYIFVAVIVLIKLFILFMKYIVNPETVSDEKIGSSALIKRVVIGMCVMLFLPTIFNAGLGLQKAVLSDNLFGKILLNEQQIKTFEKDKDNVGRILAFGVYQAFWNMDTTKVTNKKLVSLYNQAVTTRDPFALSGIDGQLGINARFGGGYAFDYFPFLSSLVLFYVLYLVLKYCLDVVVRMFKLFLLQLTGPLAISDYMVNGDSKDLFKNWMKTTLSVYAMLFVRIFSIWFIAFITILMQQNCTSADVNGVCKDSLLYMVNGKADYLLRALITLGLLAVLMDLPKFFSDLFGLDLEQDASVKSIVSKAGGAAKAVGIGALTAGGAAIGGAVGGMKGASSIARGDKAQRNANKGKIDAQAAKNNPEYAKKMKNIQDNKSLSNRKKMQQANALRKDYMNSLNGTSSLGSKGDKANQKLQGDGTKQEALLSSSAKAPGVENMAKAVSPADSKANQKPQSEETNQNTSPSTNQGSLLSSTTKAPSVGSTALKAGTSVIHGAAKGALTGIAKNLPGVKNIVNGYESGKGDSLRDNQEKQNVQNEQKAMTGAYSKAFDEETSKINQNMSQQQKLQSMNEQTELLRQISIKLKNDVKVENDSASEAGALQAQMDNSAKEIASKVGNKTHEVEATNNVIVKEKKDVTIVKDESSVPEEEK